MASMAKKKILGRQKIPMKKIEEKSSLQVSFSKRRSGLFKKASELSVLCGAEISIVAFSPAGKAFSFGHPSVESVVKRYLDANRGGYDDCSSTPPHSQHHDDLHHLSVHWDNREYMNLAAMLEEERRKKAAMEEKMQKNGADGWMDFVDVNIDEMGLQELQQLKMRLEDLKSSISGYTLVPSENPMPVLVPSENPMMFEAVPSGEMMFQTMPCEDSLEEWFLGLPTPLPDYLF